MMTDSSSSIFISDDDDENDNMIMIMTTTMTTTTPTTFLNSVWVKLVCAAVIKPPYNISVLGIISFYDNVLRTCVIV